MKASKAVMQLKALKKLTKQERLAADRWKGEWQTLVAILLSAQTRDDVTIPVATSLFKKFPSPKKLASARVSSIEQVIKSINYYKTKARNVKKCMQVLVKEHKGKVPHDLDKLITLPGVGRKTANVFLSERGYAAIGVDTHVMRLSKKLGWTTHKDPHKIEIDLKKLFPKQYWSMVNDTLVKFGRQKRKEEDEIIKTL
tara:strand:- start:1204 stop:1797 length:594 start_codon:yes stop_codon:yes gene_type:complete